MASQQIEITKSIAAKVLEVVDAGLVHGEGHPTPGQMCVEAAVCFAMGLPHGDAPLCVAPALRALKIRLNDSNWSSDQARAKGLRRLALAQLGSAGHLDEKQFRKRIVHIALSKSVPAALRAAASIHKDEKHKAALCEAANRCEKETSRQAAIDARATAAAAAAADDDDDDAAAATTAAANAAAYADSAYAVNATAAANAAAYAVYAYAVNADDAADAVYADDAVYAAAAANAAAAAAGKSARDKSTRDKSLADYAESIVQVLIEMKAPGCQWLSLTEAA